MERVSDAKVEWLIDGLLLEAWRIPPSIARRLKSALTELLERRAKDSELIASTKDLTQAMNDLRDRRTAG